MADMGSVSVNAVARCKRVTLVENHCLPATFAFPPAQADQLQAQRAEPNPRLPPVSVSHSVFKIALVETFLQPQTEFQ